MSESNVAGSCSSSSEVVSGEECSIKSERIMGRDTTYRLSDLVTANEHEYRS